MTVYKIIKQHPYDERTFTLEDIKTGEKYDVDIYTDGKLGVPKEYYELCEQNKLDEANDIFDNWLKSFVGKTIEIERIQPYMYFSSGETTIIKSK